MAGPFALPGNTAQDIAPIQLSGGAPAGVPSDTDSTLNLLNQATEAVKTVGTLNQKRLETEAVSGVQEDIKAVRDALQISKHPNLAKSFFSNESLQDPYIKEVYSRFTEIRSAADQGRLSQEYALERMESIMSEAVSRRPQFADSIRKAANDTAGANISSKLFTQIMSTSAQQQVDQKLQQEAARLGLPVEVYQGYIQQAFLIEQDKNALNWRKERGVYTANDMAKQVRLGVTSVTRDVQAELLAAINQGGVQDPEVAKAFARNQFTMLRNEVLGNIPGNVDGSLVNSHIATLDAEEERVLSMIDDGSMVKLLQSGRGLFEEMANQDVRENNPDIARLFSVMGKGEGAINILTQSLKFRTNPDAFKGLYKTDQAGVLELGSILLQQERASQIINGEVQAESPEESRLAGFQAAMRLKHDTTPTATSPVQPQEAIRLVDAVTQAGEEYSTITLADPHISNAVKGYKETWGQVINHYTNDLAALQIKYDQLKRQGIISDEMLKLEGGRLELDNTLRTAQFGASNFGTGGTTESAALSTFVRQANQTLRMGQVYKANGVFPATVFESPMMYVDSLKKPTNIAEPQAPRNSQGQEVIDVTFNPDGSFNFGGQ